MTNNEDFLKPEHYRALHFLTNALKQNIRKSTTISQDVWIEGNIQVLDSPFSSKDIPAGDSWRWNQTKGRKKMHIPGECEVSLAKLIPRRKDPNAATPVPTFKLWSFVLTYPDSASSYIIWCEKGNIPTFSRDEEHNDILKTDLQFICN